MLVRSLSLLMLLRGLLAAAVVDVFGLSAGVGLLNKPSMAFFLIAVGLGLLCTRARRMLWSRWAAAGIALMVLIALPNVLWQIHHHWPTLEFLRNGREAGKNTMLESATFLSGAVCDAGAVQHAGVDRGAGRAAAGEIHPRWPMAGSHLSRPSTF